MKGISTVSFDVFDTLLVRPFLDPAQLFELMEPEAAKWSGDQTFRSCRQAAEREARDRAAEAGKEEVTLGEIYQVLAEQLDLPAKTRDDLQAREIKLECLCCRARPGMRQFVAQAAEAGKRVLYLSDTYLPEELVARLLRDQGYPVDDNLIVSCAYRLSKAEGSLYPAVLAKLDHPAHQWLHIGDDPISDVAQAKRHNLRTLAVSRPAESLLGNRRAQDIWGRWQNGRETGVSIALGCIANHLCGDPASPLPSPDQLLIHDWAAYGYQVLGILYLSYAQWILQQARELNLKHLYFLSRDCYVIKPIYEQLAEGDAEAPPATYLYTSRRALRVASVRQLDESTLAQLTASYRPLSIGEHLQRIGLEPASLGDQLADAGFDYLEQKVGTENARARLQQLIRKLEPQLLAKAGEERETLLAYYREQGLGRSERQAIVDIGWSGSSQQGMTELLGRQDNKLVGLYVGTCSEAANARRGPRQMRQAGYLMRGYLFEEEQPACFYESLNKSIAMAELMFSAPHGSLLAMERTGDTLRPTFDPSDCTPARLEFVEQSQAGALAFVKDVLPIWQACPWLELPRRWAIAPLSTMIWTPTLGEACAFDEIPTMREFGQVEPMKLCKRPSRVDLFLRPLRFARDQRQAIWPSGYRRRLGRLSRTYMTGLLYLHKTLKACKQRLRG